jgi:hypothetical protein
LFEALDTEHTPCVHDKGIAKPIGTFRDPVGTRADLQLDGLVRLTAWTYLQDDAVPRRDMLELKRDV